MTEFISREYGQKELEVIIKTDSKEHYDAALNFARRLIDHAKPKTNADLVRSMSDEELASFMLNFFVETMDINEIPHEEVTEEDKTELLRQLKQPVEE